MDTLHFLATIGENVEASLLLGESLGLSRENFRDACPSLGETRDCSEKLPLSPSFRMLMETARVLSEEVPDRSRPGLLDTLHLIAAATMTEEICSIFEAVPLSEEEASSLLEEWYARTLESQGIEELIGRIQTIRENLQAKLFGQDHAIHAFVEGLFNSEVVASADTKRKGPRSIFVFAGPTGVGKTFLAELAAQYLDRPFARFDMSSYSGNLEGGELVGMPKQYSNASPGKLTGFVEKNPDALLLFDEIEKAHLNVIHFFLQILDAGHLEDKYLERSIPFRETTIIFTTNAGRTLYEKPNQSGLYGANAEFHRRTILDALGTETNPQTREPYFPQAICSRMATGYPVMFNHLQVHDLNRIVQSELERVGELLGRQYFKSFEFDEVVSMCLVLREGAKTDARTLRSQAESFVKTEFFKLCQLFEAGRLEEVLGRVDRIRFGMDEDKDASNIQLLSLFEKEGRPKVLFIADPDLVTLYTDKATEIEWITSPDADTALEILAEREVDLVLLDPWIGEANAIVPGAHMDSIQHFDHAPVAARRLGRGQEMLRKIRDRMPDSPVFLLSLAEPELDDPKEGSVDGELLMACMRGGGARGVILSQFTDTLFKGWEEHRDQFVQRVVRRACDLYREKSAISMGREQKVLAFDTAPKVDNKNREISIRIRNLRQGTAISAVDAGEIIQGVDRPSTRFGDVIGADAAKEELQFFVDFLKNPKRFAALGLNPPKGVLLHGPPGTGKTLLARAMAGESDVAFISAAAGEFVTKWQGSGPQAIRDLFDRARRYAPSIVFIDEIDTIGKKRTGDSSDRANEETLNMLLTEMDGFSGVSKNRPVFVLAATNYEVKEDENAPPMARRSDVLDPALVRRFSRTILVDNPDQAARRKYLLIRLRSRSNCEVAESTIDLIAERSTGFSIAKLEIVIETAARAAARAGTPLTGNLLEQCFETEQFGEQRARTPEEVWRTSVHEAGHVILYWLSGWWPSYVTVISRGDHGGYMAPSTNQPCGSMTREELLARIRTCLGGRAAEIYVFGEEEGISTGPCGDFMQATDLAKRMVCLYGMNEEFGYLAKPSLLSDGAHSPILDDEVRKILDREMKKALMLLTENGAHLQAVTDALVSRERLDGSELREILPPIPNDNSLEDFRTKTQREPVELPN